MGKVIAYISGQINSLNSWFKNKNQQQQIIHDELDKLISKDLTDLSNFEEKQKLKLNDDIKKMISYYNGLTEAIESRRNSLIDSSWQTLSLLIASSGVLIVSKLEFVILVPIILIFGVQIIFAILKLHEYQVQSAFRYPFIKTKYGNKWKWFYYGNPYISSINPTPFHPKANSQNSTFKYLEGFHFFLEKYKNETLDNELHDNIQQLYLLQVHNFYKNKFYLRLSKYNEIANTISFILLSIYIGIILGIGIFNLLF